MEPGLQASAVFGFTVSKAVDQNDCVNSSNTYGFIAEVMAVEVDPETAAIKILRYATVHDAGTIINPMIAEGQIYGGALHGLGGALFEELAVRRRRAVPDGHPSWTTWCRRPRRRPSSTSPTSSRPRR